MRPIRLETVVILGLAIYHITSIRIASKSPDCLAVINTCISDLCRNEQAFFSGICNDDDEGCQIQGSKVCNMTVPSILDQFPSLQGCMCAWEEEPCTSLDVLTTQCHQKPALQKRSASVMDWQSSNLIGYVYDSAGSCTKQMTACIHDKVCNRYLVHLVQACDADPCNDTHCRRATQQFYGDMPRSVAEMLFMCECESWDQSCLLMKNTLHSGTCGDEIRACQEGVIRCLGDRHCRTLLKTFQSKCWNDEDSQCSDSDDRNHECISQMDPALILSADVECRKAFLATVGTALQHPCTCRGLYDEDLRQCNALNEILHNRSHFMITWKKISGPYKPAVMDESAQTWITDHLIYVFAYVLLIGVVLSVTMIVFYKVWTLRRTDKTKYHPPGKGDSVVIF